MYIFIIVSTIYIGFLLSFFPQICRENSNRKTLEVYLNQELEKHIGDNLRDAGASKKNAGTAALKIIEEAGFIEASTNTFLYVDNFSIVPARSATSQQLPFVENFEALAPSERFRRRHQPRAPTECSQGSTWRSPPASQVVGC